MLDKTVSSYYRAKSLLQSKICQLDEDFAVEAQEKSEKTPAKRLPWQVQRYNRQR